MTDEGRFREVVKLVLAEQSLDSGIGTLSEKAMHRTIKLYIEPRADRHEVAVGDYVADVLNERGIFEIQTGELSVLRPKLEKFLTQYPVTVVHPIPLKWRVKWVDAVSGDITSTGRQITGNGIYSAGYGLFKLRDILLREGFSVLLLTLSVDEYRKRIEKRRCGEIRRIERIPRELLGCTVLKCKEDYLAFLPDCLGDSFTCAEYLKGIRARSRYDQYCLRLLCELGLLEREKDGKRYIYRRKKND